MKYISICIDNNFSEEQARFHLESEGLTFLFTTEDDEVKEIAVSWKDNPEVLKTQFSWIQSVKECEYDHVNWNDQWQIHGENYKDGLLTIDLSSYGIQKSFVMKPGPGFGDLSHPTTKLSMEKLVGLCRDKSVVDIGCGSGVLSLAAACAGAQDIFAIDIDTQAVEHTKANAALNEFDDLFSYELPSKTSSEYNWLLVMNMIHSEQRQAWSTLKDHFSETPYHVITSGILVADKEPYLIETQSWGWELIDEINNGTWACFSFKS